MTNKYFLFEDISSKWLELAKASRPDQEIFIFSPFITGNLITDICKAASNNSIFVVTSLSPDAYLGGALDVEILTDLLSKDVKVFHLPRLHAKLMLVGSSLTVGSQNFTDGGKSNVESSIVSDIPKKQIESVEEKITDLLKVALVINKEMLEKFVRDCEKLREQYEKTKKMLEAVDKKIERYTEIEIEGRKAASQEVKNIKSDFEKHYVSIPIVVREVEYDSYFGDPIQWEGRSYFTLASPIRHEILNIFIRKNLRLTQISTDNQEYLENQKRYLCFELKNFQLFWICANKKQIGKFQQTMVTGWQAPCAIGKVTISFQNPDEVVDFANIKIQFDTQKYGEVSIGIFFTGKSFHVKSHSNKPSDKPVEIIKDWKIVWSFLIQPILDELPSQILTPFNFANKNTGKGPTRLFKADQKMKLGLQKYEDKLFYILDDT